MTGAASSSLARAEGGKSAFELTVYAREVHS